ncbi:MAG: hypothetical protein WAW52_11040 [Methanothrix sp.]
MASLGSSFAILARYRKQRRAAAVPCFCAARVTAGARGRGHRAGPSGIAAMSSGRAGLPGKRSCKGGQEARRE